MSRYGGDYPPARAPERWDRARFEAASRAPVMERDSYEEFDYYSRAPARERSPPPVRERSPPERDERERFVFREQEQYDYRPRRERYYEDDRDEYAGAMVHRPREERDIEIDIKRRDYDREPRSPPGGGRPTFVRRQSSLDTHDRRPLPRYGDRLHEETIYMPSSGRRKSSARYDEYDEVRVADPGYYGDENYHGYREREIERIRRRRSPSPAEGGSGGEEVIEEKEEKEEIVEKEFPRKGKTKMPMRLVNKRAITQLGYPFEEENETIIILKALGKEHIDEVISLSKEMNKADTGAQETKTTYIFEKQSPSPPPEGKVVERRTEVIRESSPASEVPRSVREWDVMSKKSSKSKVRSPSPAETNASHHSHHTHHSHHSRRKSRSSRARSVSTGSTHRAVLLEEREESETIRAGVGALVIQPDRRRRSKSISREIKALEAERKALQLEREAGELRGEGTGGEIVIARERDDVVEVKKDKKAPDPKIIRAMLATLT